MAITGVTTRRLPGGGWIVTAVSDLSEPTFYWYRDGLLIDMTRDGSRQFDLSAGELAQIDVLDSLADAPADAYPSRCLISTAPGESVVKSRVEEYTDGKWVTRHTAHGAHVGYQTRVLADGETAQFRVVPVNAAGIDGRPRPLTVTQVCRPNKPALAYTWNPATTRITLTSG